MGMEAVVRPFGPRWALRHRLRANERHEARPASLGVRSARKRTPHNVTSDTSSGRTLSGRDRCAFSRLQPEWIFWTAWRERRSIAPLAETQLVNGCTCRKADGRCCSCRLPSRDDAPAPRGAVLPMRFRAGEMLRRGPVSSVPDGTFKAHQTPASWGENMKTKTRSDHSIEPVAGNGLLDRRALLGRGAALAGAVSVGAVGAPTGAAADDSGMGGGAERR